MTCTRTLNGQRYRKMALKVKSVLKKTQKENVSWRALSKRKFIDMVDEMTCSVGLRILLKAELKNFKRRPCGRVWTLDDKLFSLALYKRSQRAYRFLRKHILLPCESTLKSILHDMSLEPGICRHLLALLEKHVSQLKSTDRNCVILFDEIFLTGRLHFS